MKRNYNHWWHGPGKRFSPIAIVGMVIGGIVLAVLFAFLFGWAVLLLWNALMPKIFGLPEITYWQAWGLVLLSHILVKGGWGSGGNGGGPHGRHGRKDVHEFSDDSDDWCEDCSTCGYTGKCRPYAHGWMRTADGWKRDSETAKRTPPDAGV